MNVFSLPQSNDYKDTKFLTGFRAYAALVVMLIHSGGAGLHNFGDVGVKIVDFGKYGVIVFFVLSAFTIINSISNAETFKYKTYIVRRLFRIVPLYVTTLAVGVFIVDRAYLTGERVGNFIIASSFVSFFDIGNRNNILSVEWTIPIEVFFYLLLPVFWFYFSKRHHFKKLLNIIVISLCITLITLKYTVLPYYNYSDSSLALFYSAERYAFTYACGVGVYYFLRNYRQLRISSWTLLFLLVSLLIYIVLADRGIGDLFFVTIWTVTMIIVCSSRNKLSRLLFENRIVQYLGTVSYSFYLTHVMILGFLSPSLSKSAFFTLGFIGTLLVSSITYFFIEKPFIQLGKKLTKKI